MAEPSIRVAHPRMAPHGKRVRDVPVELGLPRIEDLEEELFGYADVLLGRQEPPIDEGLLTLLEVSNAYLARAYELEMMLYAGERDRAILRGSAYYKFRTGELRSFIEMARKCQDLGSRRLTAAQMEVDSERSGRDY